MSVRPLRDAFRLPALDISVARARKRVLDRLTEWKVDQQTCDDAQLLTSELFTNAVRHTASEKISCELWLVGRRLCLEVTDEGGGPQPHQQRGPGEGVETDGESGRGLLLVSVLANDWGIRRNLDGGPASGHAVWAELTCSPVGGGH